MSVRLRDVTCVRAGKKVLDAVALDVQSGRVLALVGPNGAGKSTLLAAMSGDLPLASGEVTLDEQPLARWSTGELAKRRSVLLQQNDVAFAFTAHDVVAMGRAPWPANPDDDRRRIADALNTCDVAHLAERPYRTLSGGERARVSLARVLAQDTTTVLLDEPTAALDLGHQEDVMRVARRLATAGRAVVVVLHDLSLAAAYADDVAVLARGRLHALGSPDEVLTPEVVDDVYGVKAHRLITPDGHAVIVPRRETRPIEPIPLDPTIQPSTLTRSAP